MMRLVLFVFFALPLLVEAQSLTFSWMPVPATPSKALRAELERWEVFAIDADAVAGAAAQHPKGVDMVWQFPDRQVAFRLFADDIRSKDYRLTVAEPSGTGTLPAGPNITYGGRVAGGGAMRMTLDAGFVFGYWEQDGKTWFVQPLRDFEPDAAPGHFVVYETSAVKPVPHARCGWTHTLGMKEKSKFTPEADHAKMAGQCYEVEIAIASDYQMLQYFGSVAATQNFTLGVLNNLQNNYDNEFADEIRFVAVANFVSSCATCDPWTSSTLANTLLVSFREWGNNGGFGVGFDVASLWSNRDFNGDVIGLAWLGSTCSGSRYNVLQRFSSNAQLLRVLQAHELGHNFDADHDPTGSSTIMAPSVNSTNTWSSTSVNDINAFVNIIAGSCLSSCGGSGPQAPVAQINLPVTHVCPGSVVPIIDASLGSPTSWAWSLFGAIPSSSNQQSPTVVYNSPGVYPVQLTVSNSGGSDTQFAPQDIVVNDEGQRYLLYETFENGLGAWEVVNPDNGTTWDVKEVGGSPYGKRAAWMNHFSYSGSGQVDGLMSPVFSLQGMSNPVLRIDYAYRRRTSSSSEQLRVKVSTNGGASFPVTLFTGQENGSGNFATGGLSSSAFTPASASDWCYTGNPGSATCIELSLASFIGQGNVRILIESVNAGNNNLYVDNVRLQVDCVPSIPPVASIGAQPTTGCAPLTVSFQDNSAGAVDYRLWNFPGGNPPTSDAAFPVVTYTQPGSYSVALEVFNGAGSSLSVLSNFIQVKTSPVADFTFVLNGNTVQFNNTSQGQGSYVWAFGNGQTSLQTNPAYTYPQPGTYTVRLTASNECGQSVKERTVTILAPPVASYTASPSAACAPVSVQFTNNSTGNPSSYQWNCPGGTPSSSSLASPSVTYAQAGTYTVTLIVSNAAGSDTLSQTLTLGAGPSADFNVEYVLGQATAVFTNTSSGADSIRWHVAGQTGTDEVFSASFPGDGEYTVQLIAYNTCGADTAEQRITIVTPPQAGFNFNAGTGCAPATVQFIGTASANTASWQWTFPGGNPAASSMPDPLIIFEQPGAYEVTLVVGNAAGFDTLARTVVIGSGPSAGFHVDYAVGQSSATFSDASTGADSIRWYVAGQTGTDEVLEFDFPEDGVYAVQLIAYNACGADTAEQLITVVTPPQAGFNFNAGAACAPASVQFTTASSANTASWQWTFPGGNPAVSALPDPLVSFEQPGTYEVTLVVGNAAGFDTLTQVVVIGGGPLADFSTQYDLGQTSAAFTNTSSNAETIRWHVAGQTSTDETFEFDFPEDGIYTVQLVAYNTCGADTATQQVTIVTPPLAGFNFNAGAGCAPATVQFTAAASANTTSWQWTFQGGVPAASSLPDPQVIFELPGTYEATLIVGNAAGFDTLTQMIEIGTAPTADFDFVVNGTNVQFNSHSSDADTYFWDFGDGNNSDLPHPSHAYAADGDYIVKLIVVNACGADSLSLEVTINSALPVANFRAENREGCAPLEVQFVNESSDNATSFLWNFPGGMPESSTEPNPVVTYAQPGAYTVSLTAGNATGSASITRMEYVEVISLPQSGFTYTAEDGVITFRPLSDALPGLNFHWDFGDETTSDSYTPRHTYAANGTYTVTLELSNDCGTVVSTQQIEVMVNALAEADQRAIFRLFPNPASGLVWLEGVIASGVSVDRWSVRFRDALGRPALEIALAPSGNVLRQEIGIDHLPAGVYTCEVWNSAGRVAVFKLVAVK